MQKTIQNSQLLITGVSEKRIAIDSIYVWNWQIVPLLRFRCEVIDIPNSDFICTVCFLFPSSPGEVWAKNEHDLFLSAFYCVIVCRDCTTCQEFASTLYHSLSESDWNRTLIILPNQIWAALRWIEERYENDLPQAH